MTREASVELLSWDKGPLYRSWSHRISWMGLQLCRTNIYTVSCYWNILTWGDKNRQGDWKVRYTCTTFRLYLRICYWIIHWSKLRKYNNEWDFRVFIYFGCCKRCNSGMVTCILAMSLKCNWIFPWNANVSEVYKILQYISVFSLSSIRCIVSV